MTSIVNDFDAIRSRMPSAELSGETYPSALAALIAEERRAWDTYEAADEKAEGLGLAWRRKEDPNDERTIEERTEEHIEWIGNGCPGAPAPIAALYAEAKALEAAAHDLTERIINWVPDSIDDAIRWLKYAKDLPDPGATVPSMLAGLRSIIAGAGDPVAVEPVTGDRRILGLFRSWTTALRHAEAIASEASPGTQAEDEFVAQWERARGLWRAVVETPAEGVAGLAVKLFLLHHESLRLVPDGYEPADDDPCTLIRPREDELVEPESLEIISSAIRDIARLVPELAPLCAPALAEGGQP
jgi:hypothetical protein